MNTLLNRLVVYMNTCLKKDVSYEIASYIVEHYLSCQHMTLQDVYENCYVSRASVARFCHMFGFSSWSTFHRYLVKTKKIRKAQLQDRDPDGEIEKSYQMICSMGEWQGHPLMEELRFAIEEISKSITESKRIYIYGAMYPLSLALTFQTDMISSGKVVYCDFQNDIHKSADLQEYDIAIILTATGRYIAECKESFNHICFSKAKKVVISCNPRYQDISYIDYYLHIPISRKGNIKEFDYYLMAVLDILSLQFQKESNQELSYATT